MKLSVLVVTTICQEQKVDKLVITKASPLEVKTKGETPAVNIGFKSYRLEFTT